MNGLCDHRTRLAATVKAGALTDAEPAESDSALRPAETKPQSEFSSGPPSRPMWANQRLNLRCGLGAMGGCTGFSR